MYTLLDSETSVAIKCRNHHVTVKPSICIVEVSEIKGAYKFYNITAKKAKHVQCTINILIQYLIHKVEMYQVSSKM